MQLVGREGLGWGRVGVHRAVIVPLCPLIADAERDVTREDPVIILPQFSVELLQAFASLFYTGSAVITDVVTIGNLLELMESFGLKMPRDRLFVTREEFSDVQIVGFKNRSSLEIIQVNSATSHQTTPKSSAGRRRTLEITKTPQAGSVDVKSMSSKIVQTPQKLISSRQKKRWPSTRRKTRSGEEFLGVESDVEDENQSDVAGVGVKVVEQVLEIKLECEDGVDYLYDVGEVQSTRKRKWSRRSETLQKPTHQCNYCDYQCRFKKDLQEHCNLFHSDKEFACPEV